MIGSWMLYALICAAGTIGNGLVIYVVLRYSKMRNSVTNSYIVNLAVSDFCFLIGLPFVIVTAVRRQWIFGYVCCKLFYSLTALNWFTSVFTLTVMSADRYLAVCHAIESRRYRTPCYSRAVCVGVWVASLLVMTPMYIFSRTVGEHGRTSCTIEFPEGKVMTAQQAFIWYAFSLGFAIPVAAISVFYLLVVIRLGQAGSVQQSKGKKKSRRRVTRMVLTVIAVYVICWLPYWLFQVIVLYVSINDLPQWLKTFYQLITILTYANSTMNPILYAFLSDNFRRTFARSFGCATAAEVERVLKKTAHQPSEMMPDDGARPARTTAIRLDSLKDQAGLQIAERHQLIVEDGLRRETGNCSAACHSNELEMLCPQNDGRQQNDLLN